MCDTQNLHASSAIKGVTMSQTITAAVTVQDLAGTAQLLAHSMQRLISASRSLLIAHHLDATDPTLTSILRTLTLRTILRTLLRTLIRTLLRTLL
jgi:hypothetical protein